VSTTPPRARARITPLRVLVWLAVTGVSAFLAASGIVGMVAKS